MIELVEVKDMFEIKKVEGIANKIWNEHYVPIIGKVQVDYMLSKFQSMKAIKNQIEEGYRYFLIRFSGEYAGYLAVLPDTSNNKMFLSKLYIDKELRGRGIAKAAILYIEDMCKQLGLDILWLTVNKNNASSISAYKKIGFIIESSIVQDIGNGFTMDDYKMTMQI